MYVLFRLYVSEECDKTKYPVKKKQDNYNNGYAVIGNLSLERFKIEIQIVKYNRNSPKQRMVSKSCLKIQLKRCYPSSCQTTSGTRYLQKELYDTSRIEKCHQDIYDQKSN